MRIGFISDAAFPWHLGGLEAVELTEAQELAKGHDVHFFCMRWPGMERTFTKDNIRYHTSMSITRDTFYRHRRRSMRAAAFFSISMIKLFKYRFDVVEVNQFPFIHLPIVKLFCKLTGCKMILDVVEIWDKKYWTEYLGPVIGRLGYWYTNYFCVSSDVFLVNSSITEQKLLDKGIGKHRIFRFAPVLDDGLIEKIKRKRLKKEQRIIFWGRFIKEKRIDKWLAVFKDANKRVPKLRGLIIGGGAEETIIKRTVHEMGLGKKVEVRQSIADDEKLFEEVARSKLLLHMSEREGLSVVALESLALGVPVLLPDYTPIPEEIKRMCIVEKENMLSKKIVEIAKSKNPGKYISDKPELKNYYFSTVSQEYSKIFQVLGKQ